VCKNIVSLIQTEVLNVGFGIAPFFNLRTWSLGSFWGWEDDDNLEGKGGWSGWLWGVGCGECVGWGVGVDWVEGRKEGMEGEGVRRNVGKEKEG